MQIMKVKNNFFLNTSKISSYFFEKQHNTILSAFEIKFNLFSSNTTTKQKYLKKKNFFREKKYIKNYVQQPPLKTVVRPISKSILLYNLNDKGLEKNLFSLDKLSIKIEILSKLTKKSLYTQQLQIFLTKLILYYKIQYKIFWKQVLITIADLKKWGVLEHYDYFGLYSTARNFFSVHSELDLNWSAALIDTTFIKGRNLNVFFKRFYPRVPKFESKIKKLLKIIWNYSFISKTKLQRSIFKKFFLPFCTGGFEKTDPIHRLFFLDKYQLYRKLLPNSWRDLFSYLSKVTRAQKYMYKFPYHLSAIFFKNLANFFFWKKQRFLQFKYFKTKTFFKNFIFAFANMLMQKVVVNNFTKRTMAHFAQPANFVRFFIKKLYENKKNWLASFSLNSLSLNKYKKILWSTYALNWSSAKRYFWKCLEHESYERLEYLKNAKYARRDYVVENFNSWTRKFFIDFLKKFNYNSLDFNSKNLLRNLIPKLKLVEYNCMKFNYINHFVKFIFSTRRFTSAIRIFWASKKIKVDRQILVKKDIDFDFDFDKLDRQEQLTDVLWDLWSTQIFLSTPYELPIDYYLDNFVWKRKFYDAEIFFPRNLLLSATILKFPIVLNSWLFKEWFFFFVKKKTDTEDFLKTQLFLEKFKIQHKFTHGSVLVKHLTHFKFVRNLYFNFFKQLTQIFFFSKSNNNNIKYLLITYFDKFFTNTISEQKYSLISYLFLLNFLSTLLIDKNNFKKLVEYPSLVSFNLKRLFLKGLTLHNNSKIFFRSLTIANTLHFTQALQFWKNNPITFFWMVGYKRTKSSGILTGRFFNFNIFLPKAYFFLSIAWYNTFFLSYDDQQPITHLFERQLILPELAFTWFVKSFANFLFDNFFYASTTLNYKFWKTISNLLFINTFKIQLMTIVPSNRLLWVSNVFWYDQIIMFENLSTNILTSKMRWNTVLQHYFTGPINVVLQLNNPNLLLKFSKTKSKYFKTLHVLSFLETQQLVFHELLIAFKVSFWKFILQRSINLAKMPYDDDFFFFFKNFFIDSFYSKTNFLELHLLTNYINSSYLESLRFISIEKTFPTKLHKNMIKTHFFPDILYEATFLDKFNLWWSFFGVGKNFLATPQVEFLFSKIFIFILYLARLLVTAPIEFSVLQNFSNKNIFKSLNYIYTSTQNLTFLSPTPILSSSLLKKKTANFFSFFRFTSVKRHNRVNFFLKEFLTSNFYLTTSKIVNILTPQTQVKFDQFKHKNFYTLFLNFFSKKLLKKIYVTHIDKPNSIYHEKFPKIKLLEFFFFKFGKYKKSTCYSNFNSKILTFNSYLLQLKTAVIFFLFWRNFCLQLSKKYLNKKFVKILLILRLFFISTKLNKKSIQKNLIFFIKFMYFLKKIHKFNLIENKLLFDFFLKSFLKKTSLTNTTHQTFFVEKLIRNDFLFGLLSLLRPRVTRNKAKLMFWSSRIANILFFRSFDFFIFKIFFLINNQNVAITKKFFSLFFFDLTYFFSFSFLKLIYSIASFSQLQLNFFGLKTFFFQFSKTEFLNLLANTFLPEKLGLALTKTTALMLKFHSWNNLLISQLFFSTFLNKTITINIPVVNTNTTNISLLPEFFNSLPKNLKFNTIVENKKFSIYNLLLVGEKKIKNKIFFNPSLIKFLNLLNLKKKKVSTSLKKKVSTSLKKKVSTTLKKTTKNIPFKYYHKGKKHKFTKHKMLLFVAKNKMNQIISKQRRRAIKKLSINAFSTCFNKDIFLFQFYFNFYKFRLNSAEFSNTSFLQILKFFLNKNLLKLSFWFKKNNFFDIKTLLNIVVFSTLTKKWLSNNFFQDIEVENFFQNWNIQNFNPPKINYFLPFMLFSRLFFFLTFINSSNNWNIIFFSVINVLLKILLLFFNKISYANSFFSKLSLTFAGQFLNILQKNINQNSPFPFISFKNLVTLVNLKLTPVKNSKNYLFLTNYLPQLIKPEPNDLLVLDSKKFFLIKFFFKKKKINKYPYNRIFNIENFFFLGQQALIVNRLLSEFTCTKSEILLGFFYYATLLVAIDKSY